MRFIDASDHYFGMRNTVYHCVAANIDGYMPHDLSASVLTRDVKEQKIANSEIALVHFHTLPRLL